MTIQELYYDERFNNVVYFLSECGFSSLEDLKDFDFDELLFVPGVSEEIIEDVKKLYVDIQNVQEQKADRETANEKDFRTLSAEVIKPIPLSVNFSSVQILCAQFSKESVARIKLWVLDLLLQIWSLQKILINLFYLVYVTVWINIFKKNLMRQNSFPIQQRKKLCSEQ